MYSLSLYIYIYIERERERDISFIIYSLMGMQLYMYTRLVSNSASMCSSRCCFTACHSDFGKSLGRNVIRIEPNQKGTHSETSPIGNEPCVRCCQGPAPLISTVSIGRPLFIHEYKSLSLSLSLSLSIYIYM